MFSYGFKEFFLGIIALGLQSVHSQDFTYVGSLGPSHWGEQYNSCDGKYQSPINIDLHNVWEVTFPPLIFHGFNKTAHTADIRNNGHTVLVTMDFNEPPKISGGPLNDTFSFVQFHFHWGDNDTFGSEDLINNHSYPVELHMVFHKEKYENFQNAVQYPDGVLVLAFFYELTNETNPAYDEIISLVDEIIKPDTHAILLTPPKVEDLISKNLEKYLTYSGSLTTPPCSEVVTWIDFEIPIPISSEQIRGFRNINSHQNEKLTHNFRPIQPLNGRVVYRNSQLNHLTTTQHPIDENNLDFDIDNNIDNNHLSFLPNEKVLPAKNKNNDDVDVDDIDKLLNKKNRKLKANSSSNILPNRTKFIFSFSIILLLIKM